MDGGTEDNGEDTLISGGGNDTIYGRAGNDLIDLQAGVNAGNILVRAGGGDDVIEVTLDELRYQDTIKGDAGNDTLAIVGSPADFDMFVPISNPKSIQLNLYNRDVSVWHPAFFLCYFGQ